MGYPPFARGGPGRPRVDVASRTAYGKGHGPALVALKHGAPDLTLIARRSGGEFLFQRVKEIIEGKGNGTSAHGSREMPVWGPVLHEVESDVELGELRVDAATKAIEAMQEK